MVCLKIRNRTALIVVVVFVMVTMLQTSRSAFAQTELQDGQIFKITLSEGEWAYYYVDAKDWHSRLITGIQPAMGSADVYVRKGQIPTLTEWDFRPDLPGKQREVVYVDRDSNPAIETDKWYVGIYADVDSSVWVGAKRFTQPATHTGMGSIPFDGGTTFRVWAPHANSVKLAGDFNNWGTNMTPLAHEGGGIWSLDIRNITVGHEYKYIIRNGAQTLSKIDPQTEQVTSSTGNAIVFDPEYAWTDGSFTMKSWNELIIYEMHIGTYNDTVGGQPGTFDSAIQKLDHLADLGITAIEILPINEFAGDYSWGYNPSLPFAVETAYGGPTEFKRFVDEAHAHNIAVILDVVYNHWGPMEMDMWRFDGWGLGIYGGIYFYNDERAETDWGTTRPDYGNNQVRQYIRDNVLRYAQDFHIDGFRVDSTVNIRSYYGNDLPDGWTLLQWINDEIDSTQAWKFMIAEDLQSNEWITKPTGEGGAGFDSQWDAQFVHPIRDALITVFDEDRNMFHVRDAISARYNQDAFERVIYTESHDEVANGKSRLPEEIWPGNADSLPSKKRSTLGAAIVFTAPGVPMIFMGQEFLEDGWFDDHDPLDWDKLTTFSGINLLYTDLIKLRRNWYNNTRGLTGQNLNIHHVNNSDKVVAFHRWDQGGNGDDVIVILNFSAESFASYNLGFPTGGTWKVRFNSDWEGYDPLFGNFGSIQITANQGQKDGMNYNANISIAPYSAMILSQD